MQYGSNVQLNNPTPKYSLPYNSVADPSTKRHANAIILPNRICNYKDLGTISSGVILVSQSRISSSQNEGQQQLGGQSLVKVSFVAWPRRMVLPVVLEMQMTLTVRGLELTALGIALVQAKFLGEQTLLP